MLNRDRIDRMQIVSSGEGQQPEPPTERAKRWKENAALGGSSAESQIVPLDEEARRFEESPTFGPTAKFFIAAIVVIVLAFIGRYLHIF